MSESDLQKRQRRLARPRLILQIVFLVLINSMIFGVASFGESPILRDTYLPNASTKFFAEAPTYSLVYKFQDTLVNEYKTVYTDLLLPILIFIALTLVLGRIWCAWLCPLGLPQDLLSDLREKLGIPYYRLSKPLSEALHACKYLALFLILFYSIALGFPGSGLNSFRTSLPVPYEWIDPNRALYVYPQIALGLLTASTIVPIVSIGTTLFFLATSFKIRRFWCHICPNGALMGLVHRRALFQLEKDTSKCTGCRVCARVCPMGIEQVWKEKDKRMVTHRNCTHCYSCVESCPEDDCLKVMFLGKKVVSSKSLGQYVT